MQTENLEPIGLINFTPKTKVWKKICKKYKGPFWFVFGTKDIFEGHGKFYMISTSEKFWVTKDNGYSGWVLEGKDIETIHLLMYDEVKDDSL